MRCLAILFFCTIASSIAQADRVMVFAAASLKNALDEIAASFEQTEPHSVVFNFAGSSQLARQVIADAPADVLITANTLWMDEVEKARSIQPDSRFDVTSNQLVIASNQKQTIQLNPENLHDFLSGKRIAMALVDAVPAGMYAKQALSHFGVWDTIKASVVQADNVRSALRFVVLQETPLAIVYQSDVISENNIYVAAIFPEESHTTIRYPAALTMHGVQSDGAIRFHQYLQTSDAQQILSRHGFRPLIGKQR